MRKKNYFECDETKMNAPTMFDSVFHAEMNKKLWIFFLANNDIFALRNMHNLNKKKLHGKKSGASTATR